MNRDLSKNSRRSFLDLLVHVHPSTVAEETLRFNLSYGLGGMSSTLIFLLFTTGILQLLTYEPTLSGAYSSVQEMYTHAALSGWVRNIHYWSANILVLVATLHLLRVFFTGALGHGRRLNWIIGLVLLFFVLSANFSGYLLPWDQLSYWAVTICTSMMTYFPGIGPMLMELFRGGKEVGANTLSNFFVLHIAIIPGLFTLFMVWHFWMVRKSRGLVRVESSEDRPTLRVPTVPYLIVREAAVGLGLIAVIMCMAVIWDAPLYDQANPGMSPNPAKAPWYFVGFQELLLHLHPMFAICVVPLLAAVLLLYLPFWKEAVLPPGIWFGGRRGRLLAAWSFLCSILITFLVIILDDQLFSSMNTGEGTAGMLSRGLMPVAIFFGFITVGYQLLLRRFKFTRSEVVMAGMVLCCAVFLGLTITGLWFRGPGMQLTWP